MDIEAELNYVDHQWDYDVISALGLLLSGLHSVVFNHFHLSARWGVQDSGRDQLPSASPEDIRQWKCIDAALSHPDFFNLTNFTIDWWNLPHKLVQEYRASIPELFQDLLPQFSSRVTITVEVRDDQTLTNHTGFVL